MTPTGCPLPFCPPQRVTHLLCSWGRGDHPGAAWASASGPDPELQSRRCSHTGASRLGDRGRMGPGAQWSKRRGHHLQGGATTSFPGCVLLTVPHAPLVALAWGCGSSGPGGSSRGHTCSSVANTVSGKCSLGQEQKGSAHRAGAICVACAHRGAPGSSPSCHASVPASC